MKTQFVLWKLTKIFKRQVAPKFPVPQDRAEAFARNLEKRFRPFETAFRPFETASKTSTTGC